jgi:transcriptional regulator with XRE-family HTH domain
MEQLRKLRTTKNLTQREMADYLGIDRTTYVKYETGNSEPNFETLNKLADYFCVTTDYLLGREETKKSPAETEDFDPDNILFAAYGNLTPENKDIIVNMAKMLHDRQKN